MWFGIFITLFVLLSIYVVIMPFLPEKRQILPLRDDILPEYYDLDEDSCNEEYIMALSLLFIYWIICITLAAVITAVWFITIPVVIIFLTFKKLVKRKIKNQNK